MDFLASLQSEIAAKKKKMAEVAGDKTFVRAADLEARRQQEYEEEQRKLEEKRKVRTCESREGWAWRDETGTTRTLDRGTTRLSASREAPVKAFRPAAC